MSWLLKRFLSHQVLEGLDPVRKRPGMYIGSTGQRGLHHLVPALIECSVLAPLVCDASLPDYMSRGSLCACTQVYEILDNAIDEVQAGHADTVQVSAVSKSSPQSHATMCI